MRNPSLRPYRWLNLWQLGERLTNSRQQLSQVLFFTAFYPDRPHKEKRHRLFNRAQELHGVKIIYGRFKRKEKYCNSCKQTVRGWEEKETDVNIAIELLDRAYKDEYDAAFVLSADNDLLPAIRAVKNSHPQKDIKIILPPGMYRANDLKNEAHSHVQLKERHVMNNQFADSIQLKGVKLDKPKEWS